MKKMLLIFTLGLTSLMTYAISFKANCTNATRSVIYAQRNSASRLLATMQTENNGMKKVEIKNFLLSPISEVTLEEKKTSTCDNNNSANGFLMTKKLTFRKVVFTKRAGIQFPSKLLGLSNDKRSLPVDYLCKTTTQRPIRCN